MSTPDTMTPLLSTPWVDASGKPLPVRTLPGLRPEFIHALEATYPGPINPSIRAFLATSCGLADTEFGRIDVTACCFPAEPCDVFQLCLTIAIDDAGRRWIAEMGHAFLATLRKHAQQGQTLAWLQDLSATAHAVWAHRRALALRPYAACNSDDEIRGWLSSLPSDAYVYDLRRQSTALGWPYGVAGPSACLYRCGRLPVFAVAASPPTEGGRARHPGTTSPVHPIAALSLEMDPSPVLTVRRHPRLQPMNRARWRPFEESSGRSGHRGYGGPTTPVELRPCA